MVTCFGGEATRVAGDLRPEAQAGRQGDASTRALNFFFFFLSFFCPYWISQRSHWREGRVECRLSGGSKRQWGTGRPPCLPMQRHHLQGKTNTKTALEESLDSLDSRSLEGRPG